LPSVSRESLYDRRPVIEDVDEDIAAIQAGLRRLTATNQVAAQ
jgi:hypothetical protein